MPLFGTRGAASLTGFGGLANLGYFLRNSLRFRSSASANLTRTPSVAGNQRTWTWSAWVKRGILTTDQMFFSATNTYIRWGNGTEDTLWLNFRGTGGTNYFFQTTQVFRDPAAWYHIVLAVDTTQATDTNRIKLYVNGSRITAFTTYADYPPQNTDTAVNSTSAQALGSYTTGALYFDGYMAEIRMIDGQQLTPSSFAKTDAVTGQWIPIKYSGTYGTNGYYLPFSNTTSTSTLGNDFSGNGNTWTVNNISLTAGATYDALADVPTLGPAASNYCVWSPINKSSNHTVTNGNLTAASSGGTSYGALCATIGASSGKWYWEMLYTRNGTSNSPVIGFGNDLFRYTNPPDGYMGSDLNAGGLNVINGNASLNQTLTSYGSAIATNDLVMFAMDLDNRKFYIGKNGTWFNSGNPVAGTNQWPYSATIVGTTFFPAVNMFNDTADTNFGQRSFAYTPPTGFKSLNTYNLP